MKLSKRGQSEPAANFTVGLIIGILILFVISGVAIKFYQNQSATKDSFNKLIENLENIDEPDRMVFELPSNYYLVSFNGGDVAVLDECEETKDMLKLPDSCGTESCLCYCKTDITGNLKEDACILMGRNCHPFTEEENLSFYYPECNSGVFIQGSNSGVMNLYYKEKDDKITISKTENFVPEEHEDVINDFEEALEKINTCGEDDSCFCEVSFDFLEKDYAILFEDKVLILYYQENDIYTLETEFNYNLKDLPFDENKFYVAKKEIIDQSISSIMGERIILFDSESFLSLNQIDKLNDYVQISSKLDKKENSFTFLEESANPSTTSICGSEKLELK